MKIKKGTFQLHFFLINAYIATLCVITVSAAIMYANYVSRMYHIHQNTTLPFTHHLQLVNHNIKLHLGYFQAYEVSNKTSYLTRSNELLYDVIPAHFDTLSSLALTYEDKSIFFKTDNLIDLLQHIRSQFRRFKNDNKDSSKELGLLYFPEIVGFSEKLEYFMENYHKTYVKVHDAKVDHAIQLLYWAVPILLFLYGGVFLLLNKIGQKTMDSIGAIAQVTEQIAEGNIPEKIKEQKGEMSHITNSLIQLSNNLKNVKSFAREVGIGNLDTDLKVFGNSSELGSSLSEMKESLKTLSKERDTRDWSNKGMAEFGVLIQENADNLSVFADKLIVKLAQYVGCNIASLHIAHTEKDGTTTLQQMSSYAYDRQKYQSQNLIPGEGLIGQAYLEKLAIYLDNIPDDYVYIGSGLGKAIPKYLYIQPMVANGSAEGVIELAAFKPIPDYVREFVKKLSENIAASIISTRNNQHLKSILDEANSMTEQLRSQEEELRQNTEELQATQEEMQRRIQELEKENSRLKAEQHAHSN